MAKRITTPKIPKAGGKTTNYSSDIKSTTNVFAKAGQQSLTDLRLENKNLLQQMKTAKGAERKAIKSQLSKNNASIKKIQNQMYRTTKKSNKFTRDIANAEQNTKRFAYASAAEGATSMVGGAAGTGVAAVSNQKANDLVNIGQKSEVSSGRDSEEGSENTSIADLINSLGGKY